MKYLLLLACYGLPAVLSAQNFVVTADKMNKAYIGIENRLTIVSGSCGCDALSVKADKGDIIKVAGCKYKYMATEQGIARLTIYENKGGKTVVIGENILRVKLAPEPESPLRERAVETIR